MRSFSQLLILVVTVVMGGLAPSASAQGTPIPFEEEFALATDRQAVLDQLIPGTTDYYYFHCLHHLNTGALDKVGPMLTLWIKRHGRGGRVDEIENRRALLSYQNDPATTYGFLRQRLGLQFNHQRKVPGQKPNLPTRLDPALISRATLLQRALQRHSRTLNGLQDSALEHLDFAKLDQYQLRSLLQRLKRPDYPNLPALIIRDLQGKNRGNFGSLKIHGKLLLDQLEECLRLRPNLLNNSSFIGFYLQRLQPGADVDWEYDLAARKAYLERLEVFANRLAASQNSLKVHVLYHRLVLDRSQGQYDKKRFMAYLRLPRSAVYSNQNYLRRSDERGRRANLGSSFSTGLPAVGNDEHLVRAYLMHFFSAEDSYQSYAEMIGDRYLKRLFAETKILLGQGDMEQWYSLLNDPAYYESLKERVEIEFAPTQRVSFGSNEAVSMDVDLKNVNTLLVKVFAINAFNYYREQGKEVDASINLDGLIANQEQTHEYEENPLRRVRRHFEFPVLSKPGAFVVEFIGSGMSSRAVVLKGRLHYLQRGGAAGQVLQVLNESGALLKETSVWMAGQEFAADEDGDIYIPYSTKPKGESIILRHGAQSTLSSIYQQAESYRLQAGIYVERESLLNPGTAKILLRPNLLLNHRAVSLDLLEEPMLSITSEDQDGIRATQNLRDFKLVAGQELVHEIQVPAALARISINLQGRVRNLSQGKTLPLASAYKLFNLNAIDTTVQTACALLSRSDKGFVLDVLGKNGEPRPDHAVHFKFNHRDFKNAAQVNLKTDAKGRIQLGELAGIVRVQVSGFPGGYGAWVLRDHARTYTNTLHGLAGENLSIPYQGKAGQLNRSVLSLLELRAGEFATDRFEHVSLRDGFLHFAELPAGDYDLWLKEADQHVAVKMTAGEVRDGWLLGRDRILPKLASAPLHISAVAEAGDNLEIRLANAGKDARVHVFTTRYQLAYDPFSLLGIAQDSRLRGVGVVHPYTSYHSGRKIGDEYRYILERRQAAKYPGNMLARPGLILNPWALEETQIDESQRGGAGGRFGGGRGGSMSGRGAGGPSGSPAWSQNPSIFANLQFLPRAATVHSNLKPDEKGVLQIALKDLRPGQQVHIMAADAQDTVYISHALPEEELKPRDQRLMQSIDPKGHFTERKRIEFVAAGAQAVIEDLGTSKVEAYDSLSAVFQLFATLSKNVELQKFAFILDWSELPMEKKQELYSKHSSHELNFFLLQKDPEFFGSVISPYLSNKMHKTFMDHWLLQADLTGYLEPWAYGRLNVVERILLAQRIAGEADATARHLTELNELRPANPQRWSYLFDSALQGGAMDKGAGLSGELGKAVGELKADRAMLAREKSIRGPVTGRAPGAPTTPGKAKEEAQKNMEGVVEDRAAPEMEMAEEEIERAFDDPNVNTAVGLGGRRERSKAKDAKRRDQVRQFYRAPEPTREYVEQNYWQRRIAEQNGDLITVNDFWRDYAVARGTRPFLSAAVPEANNSFAEMLLALAVLDLPFKAGEHETKTDGARFTLQAATPLLLVRKDLEQADELGKDQPFLVQQSYYRMDDRYRFEGNQRLDKRVGEEFLPGIVYGSQVVLTNLTSAPQRLEILNQIPHGAIPVNRGFVTRSNQLELAAYSTHVAEFYFPAIGTFPHFPVHVSRTGQVVAFAAARDLKVVAELSVADTSSWQYVSQSGSNEDVLQFMGAANLGRIQLDQIAWRMRDAGFFASALQLLRSRHVYAPTLWSYGVMHRDEASSRQFLQHRNDFVRRCGAALESRLLSIDPVERRAYQHIDYEPLFNPRAHRFGKERVILNGNLGVCPTG